jgi:hypothetical protein
MAIIPIYVWNHCKILKYYCLVVFIWGLWIVFRLSSFFSPNIVFLFRWEGWKYHRLNNRPVNVVSLIDYSPSSYHLDPICQISTTAYLTIYKMGRPPCIFTVYLPVTSLTFEDDSVWVTQNQLHSHSLLLCSFFPSPHLIAARVSNKSGVDYRWIDQYDRYCKSFVLRPETNYFERRDYVRPTPCQSAPRFIPEKC